MMSAYTAIIPRKPPEKPIPTVIGDYGDVRFIHLNAKLRYLHIEPIKLKMTENGPQLSTAGSEMRYTEQGDYTVLITPCTLKSGDPAESLALARLETARGLLTSLDGRNAAYSLVFNQVLELPSNQVSSATSGVEMPSDRVPFASIESMKSVTEALEALDEPSRGRINLGFRWIDQSIREEGSVDKFLKAWFALETIGIPKGVTSIKPIETALAQIYSISETDARATFQVGRIFGLRSEIVHNGSVPAIHSKLSSFVCALFMDLVFQQLGLVSEKRAQAVIKDPAQPEAEWRPR